MIWTRYDNSLKCSPRADYPCSWYYEGNCYDCLYSYTLESCHRALPSVIYFNARIYTVDTDDPDWNNVYELI